MILEIDGPGCLRWGSGSMAFSRFLPNRWRSRCEDLQAQVEQAEGKGITSDVQLVGTAMMFITGFWWFLLLLIDWNWLTVKSSSAAYCHPCFVPEDMIRNIGDAGFLWHWSWVVMNMCSSWSPICEANLANRKMQSVQSSWDLQVMHWSMSRSTDLLYTQDDRMSWQGIERTYPWNSWMSNKTANHTVYARNPAPVCRWCISSYNPIIYSVS